MLRNYFCVTNQHPIPKHRSSIFPFVRTSGCKSMSVTVMQKPAKLSQASDKCVTGWRKGGRVKLPKPHTGSWLPPLDQSDMVCALHVNHMSEVKSWLVSLKFLPSALMPWLELRKLTLLTWSHHISGHSLTENWGNLTETPSSLSHAGAHRSRSPLNILNIGLTNRPQHTGTLDCVSDVVICSMGVLAFQVTLQSLTSSRMGKTENREDSSEIL